MGNTLRGMFASSIFGLGLVLAGLQYTGPQPGISCSGTSCAYGPATTEWSINATGDLYPAATTQTLGTAAKPLGPVLAGAGLVGAPSYSFGADTDTGFYSVTPGTIGLAVNGALVWSANATPSISYGGSNSVNVSLAAATGNRELGLYIDALKGGKCKTLVESSATEFDRVSIAQTAGSNYAGGNIQWTVLFADATDQQVLQGDTTFSCANKAGTEGCTVAAVETPVLYASAGAAADDLACTIAAVTGLADMVGFSASCASAEMTQTTSTICYFVSMPVVRTTTPQ